MLQNVCENCVRILEEEKHHQLRMFVILWKEVKETGILIDKTKSETPKTVRTAENIANVAESVWSAITINSPSFSRIEYFGDIETNFA